MISVIVPVYNEEKAIIKTLNELQVVLEDEFKDYEIIVVNDGSTDTTSDRIRECGIKDLVLINHIENLGYGKSLLDGILIARNNCIGIIDGDNSYNPKDIKKLYSYFGQYDMVVGARQGKEYSRGVLKRPARLFFKMLAEYASGRKIPDVNSGLRLFKKEIVLDFQGSLCTGFSFTTTLTLIFLLNHYFVKYVSIEYVKRAGKSKVNHIRDTLFVGQIIVEAILYYDPLKLFFLLASCNATFGLLLGLFNFLIFKTFFFSLLAVICIASFIPVFSLGLIADQLKKVYNLNKKT
ncbi:MAG: glycosyltransferase family 2 protein [Candidatus Omnitrophica bacterium]|nr:glycosyltransferase family 2 protein [Candidatus Omnitrophota bacterium]